MQCERGEKNKKERDFFLLTYNHNPTLRAYNGKQKTWQYEYKKKKK